MTSWTALADVSAETCPKDTKGKVALEGARLRVCDVLVAHRRVAREHLAQQHDLLVAARRPPVALHLEQARRRAPLVVVAVLGPADDVERSSGAPPEMQRWPRLHWSIDHGCNRPRWTVRQQEM
jgi:hypothetical protein